MESLENAYLPRVQIMGTKGNIQIQENTITYVSTKET